MHNHRVYETSIDKSPIALSDDTAPLCVRTGPVFLVLFEMINSDRQATVERLHPRLTR